MPLLNELELQGSQASHLTFSLIVEGDTASSQLRGVPEIFVLKMQCECYTTDQLQY